MAALKILDNGDIEPQEFLAPGPCFRPYTVHAVDLSDDCGRSHGDGAKNIARDPADRFGSTANYLRQAAGRLAFRGIGSALQRGTRPRAHEPPADVNLGLTRITRLDAPASDRLCAEPTSASVAHSSVYAYNAADQRPGDCTLSDRLRGCPASRRPGPRQRPALSVQSGCRRAS